jgi:hypothetical protein
MPATISLGCRYEKRRLEFDKIAAGRTSMTFRSVLLIFLLVMVGCGRKSASLQVTGTVTLDGKPLEAAVVTFVPSSPTPEAAEAQGTTDAQGKYRLELQKRGQQVVEGDYRVRIFRLRPNNNPLPPGGDAKTWGTVIEVPKFSNRSEKVLVHVSPSNTAFDFEAGDSR